jgi:steroid 5-alpha reductase family enzyme
MELQISPMVVGSLFLAWLSYFMGEGTWVSLLFSIIASAWALRLSVRIYFRGRGKPEDFRYKAWRDAWGKTFVLRSFLQVYLLQGLVIFIVSLPLVLTALYVRTDAYVSFALLGVALWIIGFLFETIGDAQLDRFIRDATNKGKLMTEGLWKYTRHPNYFGESLMWIALGASSAVLLALEGYGALSLVVLLSPLLITFLLLKVSGVPMLEAKMKQHPDWNEYARKTSVFVPWIPKA